MMLLLTCAVTACGHDAGEQGGEVALSRLQQKEHFHEGVDLGRAVTVRGTVHRVDGPNSFEIAGSNPNNDPVLVVSDRPVRVTADQPVEVRGTVGQLHRSKPSDMEPYIQQRLYDKRTTSSYLYHASIR